MATKIETVFGLNEYPGNKMINAKEVTIPSIEEQFKALQEKTEKALKHGTNYAFGQNSTTLTIWSKKYFYSGFTFEFALDVRAYVTKKTVDHVVTYEYEIPWMNFGKTAWFVIKKDKQINKILDLFLEEDEPTKFIYRDSLVLELSDVDDLTCHFNYVRDQVTQDINELKLKMVNPQKVFNLACKVITLEDRLVTLEKAVFDAADRPLEM